MNFQKLQKYGFNFKIFFYTKIQKYVNIILKCKNKNVQ